MEVLFFPDNRLNATLEKYFNGHIAAITHDTDTLENGKYQLVELELFRNNITGTVFNTYLTANMTNAKNLYETGRIKFGVYNYTDRWYNPITQVYELIPDYNSNKWTAAGVAVFANAVLGASKSSGTPNHGQQMYNVSNGAFGLDVPTNTIGASNLQECWKWQEYQKQAHEGFTNEITSFSYRNGKNNTPEVFLPHYLGARNSNADYQGLPYSTEEPSLVRVEDIDKPSTCRGWDAWYNVSEFPTIEAAVNHSKMRLQEAIDDGGWFTEFIHWHAVYNFRDTPKGVAVNGGDILTFNKFFSGYNSQIGSQDVWRAGYGEVLEYFYIKQLTQAVGSFEHEDKLYIFYRIKDSYTGTTNGILNTVDVEMLNTPLSIRINTTGTYLEGKDIVCDEATLIRKLSASEWIVSVPFTQQTDGNVVKFEIREGTGDYYTSTRPTITRLGNVFTSDIPAKWIVWRRKTGLGMETTAEMLREKSYKSGITHTIEAGYIYYIGAISEFGHSSLIEI